MYIYIQTYVHMYMYTYVCIYMYVYIYICIYIHTNLSVNAIVRQAHPRSGDSQGKKTFVTPSADKQSRNYDIECSNHHP